MESVDNITRGNIIGLNMRNVTASDITYNQKFKKEYKQLEDCKVLEYKYSIQRT